MTDHTPASGIALATPMMLLPGRVALKAALTALTPLMPVAAGTATEPPQACLSPVEMAPLFPGLCKQAKDGCKAGDAQALERVRAVPRLLGKAPAQAGTE